MGAEMPVLKESPWAMLSNCPVVSCCIPNIPSVKMFGGEALEIGFDVITRVRAP